MPNLTRLRLLPVALLLLLLAACGGTPASSSSDSTDGGETAGPSATTRVVSTGYGEVEVPAEPERVVAVSYDTPWQLMSLGVRPVATQDYSGVLQEFDVEQQAFIEGLPEVGGFGAINLEKVAAAAPDLIVGDFYEVDQALYDDLSAIAPTVIVETETRGDWRGISAGLAEATGTEDELAAITADYDETLERLRTECAEQIAGNEWIHFSLGDGDGQFSVQEPSGATGDLLVNELGAGYGPNVPPDTSRAGYSSYSYEQLAQILDGVTVAVHYLNADGTDNPAIQDVIDADLFQDSEVARAGRVYGLRTVVSDYVTARTWLLELEEAALSQL